MFSARQSRNLVSVVFFMCCWIYHSAPARGAQSDTDCEHNDAANKFEKEAKAATLELKRINGNGRNRKLKAKLLAMRKVDQSIRARMFTSAAAEREFAPELQKTDAKLTEQLKKIVQSQGWPTIACVGIEASQAAALILIHSPDHEFQRHLIPELERLVQQKKIVGSDIATLIDKNLVAEGRPQRFGTQFSSKGTGPMVMDLVEDPAHLDERRRAYLLPPMDLYRCLLASIYHRKIE